ncbi:MAG: RNA polymerase sigma factor [Chitinophagaceae bacterium]
MEKTQATTTGNSTDEEIISRIIIGEKDLFSIIVRRYNQRLYRVGMSIMHNDTEIEDAMQVAYVNAYQHLQQFRSKSSFATWLTRIMINECLLRIKKSKRSITLNCDSMEHVLYQQTTTSQTPVTKMMNTELRSILEDAISKLPEKYRTVFVMREIEDMNVAETQACLDISEVNVKVRLNRAKVMLRSLLTSQYKKEDILHFHLLRCDRIVDNVMKSIIHL